MPKTKIVSDNFSDQIKEFRTKYGLSYAAVGKMIGIDGWNVSRWEAGENVTSRNKANMMTLIEKWTPWVKAVLEDGIVHILNKNRCMTPKETDVFLKNVETFAKSRGMTPKELCMKAGLSRTAWNNWQKRGGGVSAYSKEAIERYLTKRNLKDHTHFIESAVNSRKETDNSEKNGLYSISTFIGTKQEVYELLSKWSKEGTLRPDTKVIKVDKVYTPKPVWELEAE